MQDRLGSLKQHGASLVAITPQLPEHSRKMIDRHKLGFDLLSDPANDYAARLGLRFTVPDDLREIYQGFGNDLAVHNGEPSWTLPIPARFLIDRAGIIRAADVDPDYTRRPEVEKTIADLKALG